MTITQLRKNCNLSGLVYLLGFMQKCAWDSEKDFVPITRDTKKKSKTRIAMEKAAQYIAQCEQGIGLDGKKFINSINAIKNWKHWFVEYMQDKDNIQLVEACQKRIWTGKLNNKDLKCSHKNDHKLGKDGAAKLADNLFRMFYDGEVRAKEEAPIDPYFTREAGPVEWGRSMSDDTFLPRQFAEQPTGEYYSITEDEHASGWKMSTYSDDEVSEDIEILPIRTDWADRNERYFELRQDILHRKFIPQKILQKALMLAKTDLIGWGQYKKLRQFAADVGMYHNK